MNRVAALALIYEAAALMSEDRWPTYSSLIRRMPNTLALTVIIGFAIWLEWHIVLDGG